MARLSPRVAPLEILDEDCMRRHNHIFLGIGYLVAKKDIVQSLSLDSALICVPLLWLNSPPVFLAGFFGICEFTAGFKDPAFYKRRTQQKP
ncbi:hypothetical protein NDU88_001376 [Pleurodeles waltl]|uniref:Uncharacterized protein n=1 Tax=Pleurodeles waltl TaxID=8319 RepID=A0AAV7LCZ4_PLEWA|nr:hypothetical protein NDU88_001376 [Pleurodeles waltl]